MNENIGTVISESIREVEDVDVGANNTAWGNSLSVRMHLNVTKTLKLPKRLAIQDGEKMSVWFRYEKLPNFYYTCGMLDHLETNCAKGIKLY